jgi:hypothetical protein
MIGSGFCSPKSQASRPIEMCKSIFCSVVEDVDSAGRTVEPLRSESNGIELVSQGLRKSRNLSQPVDALGDNTVASVVPNAQTVDVFTMLRVFAGKQQKFPQNFTVAPVDFKIRTFPVDRSIPSNQHEVTASDCLGFRRFLINGEFAHFP